MQEVRFDQRIGDTVALQARFRDSTGRHVKLADYFTDKPVVLALVYFECPMLCSLEMSGLVRSLKALDLAAGEDFQAVVVSFDAEETPQMAAEKREHYLQQYDRPDAASGWHFLTGNRPNIRLLCESVGFHAVYDPQRDEYAHASGIVVLSPRGRITHYFYGIDYPARDLRLGLIEASSGRLGTASDHLLLLCYGYDPTTGKYGLLIMNVIRLGAAATLAVLGVFMGKSFYRDYRRGCKVHSS